MARTKTVVSCAGAKERVCVAGKKIPVSSLGPSALKTAPAAGARRFGAAHRRLRTNIDAVVTAAALKRIVYQVNAQLRIDPGIKLVVQDILLESLRKELEYAIIYTEYRKKKTLDADALIYAFKKERGL